MKTLCRDCGGFGTSGSAIKRCDACASPRRIRHREPDTLSQRRIAGDGITLIGQLAELGDRELVSRFGWIGALMRLPTTAPPTPRLCSAANSTGRAGSSMPRIKFAPGSATTRCGLAATCPRLAQIPLTL